MNLNIILLFENRYILQLLKVSIIKKNFFVMQLLSFFKNKKLHLTLIILSFSLLVFSAEITFSEKLIWSNRTNYQSNGVTYSNFITFSGAFFNPLKYKNLPLFSYTNTLKNAKNIQVSLKNEIYEPIDSKTKIQNQEIITNSLSNEIQTSIGYERGQPILSLQLLPIRLNPNSGLYEKLISFDIVINYSISNNSTVPFRKKNYATNSVLAQGDWYKIAVVENGIHLIDSTFLKNNHITLSNIDPRTIKIYGNGSGMLSQLNAAFRFDDLHENAIYVSGESDGKFDPKDQILFYGESQNNHWKYDSSSGKYYHINNIYSDTTYYFLTFGNANGKRISTQISSPSPNIISSEYDYNFVHELENVNLIKSGRLWVGEDFDKVTQRSLFANMGTIKTSVPVFVRSSVVARSFTQSNLNLTINGTSLINHSIAPVSGNFEYAFAATDGSKSTTIAVANSNINITYTYDQPLPNSIGWLDYLELQSRNFLQMNNNSQLIFRDSKTIGVGTVTQFNITTANKIRVWDLNNVLEPIELIVNNTGNISSIISSTDSLKEFIAFEETNYKTPLCIGKLVNQNLHNIPQTDYLIITHPQFINEAKQLANIYASKMRVQVIAIDQIYNEFSSGSQDVCAIRDFIRMFYTRATSSSDMPKYVLLFGRASYDYKYRATNNTNFIPTYESIESLSPVGTYNSDDFYGLLDEKEGTWDSPIDGGTKLDFLDIGIGRLPAQNNFQAQTMVNKIIGYKSNASFGDWRNRITFVADRELGGEGFVTTSEILASDIALNAKNYNVQKLYSDAYQLVEEAGGARNPAVQNEFIKSVERGSMLINYIGHGGQVGLSADRILNTDNINGWTNGFNLPLFVTATCQFSPFDDPALTSAGELVLLNPNGGGIALFSTVRLTDKGSNDILNTSFFKFAGFNSGGIINKLNLGDILLKTKNESTWGTNDRNFTLLGDPALMLAYPELKVATTSINSKPISSVADTMKAFAKVTIEGKIIDANGVTLSDYNGIVYPTVFDKPQTYTRQVIAMPPSPQTFQMQSNALYRGKVTVLNGVFKFSFIVPKDISYQNGFGKISYYSNNNTNDACGYYDNFIVGGTADSVGIDKNGPQISLFMNDEKFIEWGLTDENPLFIAKLKDESGINIVGTGIGRDLELTITNSTTNQNITLNDYYQSKLDTYQEGNLNYHFKNLAQGNNKVKLRAWDVYNNMSESTLDFVVATSADMALQHVLNYPNPFTTHTTFHFDHNKAGLSLVVSIQIFTISGKLIKTLRTETVTATSHFDELSWDGKDDFGDAIGKGVYVYKVNVKSGQGKTAQQFQKLVILN